MGAQTQSTIAVDDLTVAYTDTGEGPPILLLHGWPTSSYLWRNIVPRLAADHRVVAPDLPGFGASSKPAGIHYSFAFYARTLDALVEELGLEDIGLAVHDLGGPIGVHWALNRPGRVSRLAILNTLLFPDFSPAVIDFVTTLLDPEKRQAALAPERFGELLREGVTDPASLSDETIAQMIAPFDTDELRDTLAIAGIGVEPEGFAEIERRLGELTIPVLCLYGAKDRILPDIAQTVARVQKAVPHAEVEVLSEAGHFIQEEEPEAIGARLAAFFAA